MDTTSSLFKQIVADTSDLTFLEGDSFLWSPTTQSITYDTTEKNAVALLLHEIGHARLAHDHYSKDVSLVGMETDAWQQARLTALHYDVVLDDAMIEDHLDTYRQWLHKRSTCPACEATGLQTGKEHYRCLACSNEWRVNEARICALRRYAVS